MATQLPSARLLAAALRQTPLRALVCGLLVYIAARSLCRSVELVWASPMARGVSLRHRQGPPALFVPWRAACSPCQPRRREICCWYTVTEGVRLHQHQGFQCAREGIGRDGFASQRSTGPSHTHPPPPPSDDKVLPSLPAAILHDEGEMSGVLARFSTLPRLTFRC